MSEVVKGYYDEHALQEWHRLDDPYSRIEFTECYFATPVEARAEVLQGGFEIVTYAGAEGFLAGMRTGVTRLYREDRTVYDNLLQAASDTCESPQYRDATEHLVIVAVNRHGD